MRMQLISCRIEKFKSISDTGFFNFPIDNITAIIGQNESGKTSVLEALKTFSSGELDQDALRDEGFPRITCVFRVQKTWFDDNFIDGELPRGFKTIIKEAENKISITREWKSVQESDVSINYIDMNALFPTIDPKIEELMKKAAASVTPATSPSATTIEAAPEPQPEPEVKTLTSKEFIDRVIDSLPEFQNFIDDASLLPDKIDIKDISKKNSKAQGLHGVMNLLDIMGTNVEELEVLSDRTRGNKLNTQTNTFTADFRQFWSQKIGGRDELEVHVQFQRYSKEEPEKVGEPYLAFYIVENKKLFTPKQRSKGLLWFLSFYLQLKASSVRSEKLNSDGKLSKKDLILLIDEPAGSLHAKAQEDVLKVFEQLKKNIQVIYTTHNHYMLDLTKLYRIIAVQRETITGDQYSLADTKIYSAHELGAMSSDTLTPIFDCMGSSFAYNNVIDKTNNIIVEEISVCYYLNAIFKLKNITGVHLIPSSSTGLVAQMARLLFGWGISYGILVDDEPSGHDAIESAKKEVFPGPDSNGRLAKIFKVIPGCKGIEDIFSKAKFAELIANVDEKLITKENSTYMKNPTKKESKGLLAVRFFNAVEDGKITMKDFDDETKNKIEILSKIVKSIIAEISTPTITAPPVKQEGS